jgi:hypothetical protein
MVHHRESFQSGFSFFHDYNAIDARNGQDLRRGAVHLPSVCVPEDLQKSVRFRLTIWLLLASKRVGRLSARFRRGGTEILSFRVF